MTASPPPSTPAARTLAAAFGLVLGLLVVVWGPVAAHGLVWDDLGLLLKKASVQDLDWIGMIRTSLWGDVSDAGATTPFFRPAVVVSFGIDKALSDVDPAFVHLHSLAWHMLNTGLVMWGCRRWGGAGMVFAGVLVGLHPLVVEPVAFAASRNDLMATTFCLVALAAAERGSAAAVFLGTALACLSKESALVLPAVLLLQALSQQRRPGPPVVAASLAVLGVVLLRTACAVPWPGPGDGISGYSAQQVALAAGTLLGWTVWPMPSSPTVNLQTAIDRLPWTAAMAAAVIVGWVIARRASTERWRLAAAGLLFLTCVPAVVQTGKIASRYDYLPLLLLAPAVVEAVVGESAAAARRLWLLGGAGAIVCAIGVGLRLPEWKDETSLLTASATRNPDALSFTLLGDLRVKQGDRVAASRMYAAALDFPDGPAQACVGLARVVWSLPRDEARARVAEMADPSYPCRPIVGFDDQVLWSTAARGEWDLVRALLPGQRVSDGTGRSQAVRGAVRLEDGDWTALQISALRAPDGAAAYLDSVYGIALLQPAQVATPR